MKEKSEDALEILLISKRVLSHLQDNSKLGFNVEVVNPKNVWYLSTPDKKNIFHPSGRAKRSASASWYCGGYGIF
jgi:hypothetical protein